MNEHELRALVRDVVQRHLAGQGMDRSAVSGFDRRHPSHGRFAVLAGAETDGPCLIEPAVRCNHCGYCQSYGH
jgi:hypothetical protein